ncbi:extracellular solute-binding protein [Paenibacillus sp. GCM10027629]|uniref:extracellular solute-binding protein n=1 Tax=Paenibacillus sp. GCM10027629 TaxID=3273414 RepID=UPI00362FCC9E
MKKSLLMLLTFVFVASIALAGCGSKTEEKPATTTDNNNATTTTETTKEPEQAKPFEMTIRHTQVGEQKKTRFKMLQEVVEKTQGEVQGLTFKLDGVDSDVNRKEKLRGEMASGSVPDIFDAFGSPDAKTYAKAGKMLDITPILDELGIKDKFTNLGPWTVDGKVYGLPIGASAEAVFYNKEYFEQKGLKVPTTFDEFQTLLETIKKDGKIPLAAGSKAAWVPLMITNNLWSRTAGSDVTEKFNTGDAKWTDADVVTAFKTHKDWVDKGYFKKGELGLEYADMRTQFFNGDAVMMFDGTWASSLFKEGQDGAKMIGKVGFFNLPALTNGKGDQTSLMQDVNNGYGFSAEVAKDPQKLAAVKAFIKNLYNEDMQIRGLVEDGVLPSMKVDQAKVDASVKDPLMKEIAGVLTHVNISYAAFDAIVPADVTTEIGVQIQKLIGNQTTPEKAAESIQKVQEEANASAE